jgi:hypothetical protein
MKSEMVGALGDLKTAAQAVATAAIAYDSNLRSKQREVFEASAQGLQRSSELDSAAGRERVAVVFQELLREAGVGWLIDTPTTPDQRGDLFDTFIGQVQATVPADQEAA